ELHARVKSAKQVKEQHEQDPVTQTIIEQTAENERENAGRYSRQQSQEALPELPGGAAVLGWANASQLKDNGVSHESAWRGRRLRRLGGFQVALVYRGEDFSKAIRFLGQAPAKLSRHVVLQIIPLIFGEERFWAGFNDTQPADKATAVVLIFGAGREERVEEACKIVEDFLLRGLGEDELCKVPRQEANGVRAPAIARVDQFLARAWGNGGRFLEVPAQKDPVGKSRADRIRDCTPRPGLRRPQFQEQSLLVCVSAHEQVAIDLRTNPLPEHF